MTNSPAKLRDSGTVAASARIQAAITDTRSGTELSAGTIRALIDDFVAGHTADHQMAAWLATVACRGLSPDETFALTDAYVQGGERLRFPRGGRVVVDKHSTGGVADTVSLVVVPVVAACGVAVVKMSGGGLGFAGGTLDKLASIKGLRLDLGPAEVHEMIDRVGMCITGQNASLAPGDGATYALRDITATVESIPLIAASIMSKKVAVGADGLVLDVKTGPGALIPDVDRAIELAETMIGLAGRFGLRCRVVVTDMSEPLGSLVGNALEVREAIALLNGASVSRLSEVCRTVARLMLQSADPNLTGEAAEIAVTQALTSGAAFRHLREWVKAQGGDVRMVDEPDRLPSALHRTTVTARRSGWVHEVDPRRVGMAAVHTGAGRLTHNAELDYGAGVELLRRVGDRVDAGDPVAVLHAATENPKHAVRLLADAFTVGEEPYAPAPVIHRVLANTGRD